MSLPTPNLDDRRFQDIVDEAKRRIPRYCPQWTDHNLSDPGVALIELFAWMTEMIIYRLNQVPDRLYIKFLELVGIRLFPPAAARTRLLFRLTKPQPHPVAVPAATQVATRRSGPQEPVVFMTDREAVANPARLVACHTLTADGDYEDRWDELATPDVRIPCFPTTTAGDAVYFGLEHPLSDDLVALAAGGVVAWVGVVPARPPWAWEIWTGEGWAAATVVNDDTFAFQQDGTLELLLPSDHQPLRLGGVTAHWLRCRLTDSQPRDPDGQPRPPRIHNLAVSTVGVAVPGHHGLLRPGERLGVSAGAPAQTFHVAHPPVLARAPGEAVTVDGEPWQEVTDDFAGSGPNDHHVGWDSATGEITFGPAVHHADGTTTQHGAVPPHGAVVAVTRYRTGGGARGNVGAHTLTVLRSPVPAVASADNLEPARGGVDGETIDNARRRGPLTLLTSQRAVTATDFERLAQQASANVARVRCLPPEPPPSAERPEAERNEWWQRKQRWWEEQLREGGGKVPDEGQPPAAPPSPQLAGPIRLLLAPRRTAAPDQLDLDELVPDAELLATVRDYLDQRRTLASSIELGNLWFQGVKVRAAVQCTPTARPESVQQDALAALYRYINPLVGGPAGTGWPFDRPLTVGEIHSLLAGLDGVDYADHVELIPVIHMRRGELDQPQQRIALPAEALFASYQHEVTAT